MNFAFKMCGKMLIILVFHLLMVYTSVYTYCTMAPIPPGGDSCQYNGWTFDFGSSFEAPAPYCERCSCSSAGLGCCGYGKFAGTMSIPGCHQVFDDSTCDIIFVDDLDETKPCDGW